MYYFCFLAHPKPGTENVAQYSGAYVSCWIDVHEQSGAEHLARNVLEAQGWSIDRCDEVWRPCREDYDTDDNRDSLQYFDEATKHGSSFFFHCWGHDAPDKDAES